jgi:hypothetical protein
MLRYLLSLVAVEAAIPRLVVAVLVVCKRR